MTTDRYALDSVVVVKAHGVKDAWCLGTMNVLANARSSPEGLTMIAEDAVMCLNSPAQDRCRSKLWTSGAAATLLLLLSRMAAAQSPVVSINLSTTPPPSPPTPPNEVVVTLPPAVGTSTFTVSTTNDDVVGLVTLSAETGRIPLPVSVAVCQISQPYGMCTTAGAPSVATVLRAGETPTFAVSVTALASVPLDLVHHRVYLTVKDADGKTVGMNSVAIQNATYGWQIYIDHGGTYSGNWENDDIHTGAPGVGGNAVYINTSEPVTLENCFVRSTKELIHAADGANVTIRNCHGYGMDPGIAGETRLAFFFSAHIGSLRLEHSYWEGTRYGVAMFSDTWWTPPGPLVIRHNTSVNLDNLPSDGQGGRIVEGNPNQYAGGFVLINRGQQLVGAEIAWNEVVNEPYVSSTSDILDLWATNGTPASPINIHDNYFRGQYAPIPAMGNGIDPTNCQPGVPTCYNTYVAQVITPDGSPSDTAETATSFLKIHHNQVVNAWGGVTVTVGHDNEVYANRVVSTGQLADGEWFSPAYGAGIFSYDAYDQGAFVFHDNAIHDNVVGFRTERVDPNDPSVYVPPPIRSDYFFDHPYHLHGCSGSVASQCTNNVSLPDPITDATEAAEWVLWQQKLGASEGLTLPTVTTLPPTAVLKTSAVLGGSIISDGGTPVTGRGVCWSIAPNPTTAATCSADGTGSGTFASAVSGLSGGTWYHVRAYATNSIGTAYGNEVIVRTVGSGTDFDGDGKADVAVYRPSTGTWFSLDSSTANTSYRYRGWGDQAQGDTPVVGDFDGDGIVDPTVFRPATGTWFILESHANFTTWNWFGWGTATDTLMPGDYDGDGKTDAAVYRPSTGEWFIRPSSGATPWSVVFGQGGDVPIAGDFDGDGRRDIAVYRPSTGTWFWLTSSSNYAQMEYRGWGVQAQGDIPVPGDYDGDGKTDLAVYRPAKGTWFILKSSANNTDWMWDGWGTATDQPMPADYDGDGKTDLAIYRPSTGEWFIKPSSGVAPWHVVFGQAGDVPLSWMQPAPAPAPPGVGSTSYENYKQIGLAPQALPPGDNTVRAYGNFAGNGRLDLFRAVLTYNVTLPLAQATPSRFEFYAKQADGSFTLNTAVMPQTNGCLHPRKAIVADFNNDGRPDIFVACHGYDAPPYPGETNTVVLSQPDGTYTVSDASVDVGFNHGATAADLNGDGKIDVVVVNNLDPDRMYTLLNDGTGHFVRERTSRLPASIRNGGNYFSVELVDLNEDGKLDLLIGGHEFEGGATAAFINPGSNNFSAVAATVIPSVPNEGVVLDFTATGTGSTRTIWVLRTSGGDGTFYQSRVVQRVAYPALTSSVVLNQRPALWVPWLIPAVVNGTNVITSDNVADDIYVPQLNYQSTPLAVSASMRARIGGIHR